MILYRALSAPWRACVALKEPEGRRGAALLLMAAGGAALTVYAGYALWLVRGRPDYAFYLGLAALVLIGIVLTGFAGLLIKRTIRGGAFGATFEISDEHVQQIAAAGAVAGVAAATAAANVQAEDKA